MNMKHLLGAIACAAATWGTPALAQNLYAELGAGLSKADVDCSGTTSCDRTGTSVRAILGYEFAPNWAIEASLADLGRVKASATVPLVGNVQTSARLRSVGLGVAGTLPLGEAIGLTGRLGVASNRTSISGSANGRSVSDSETHTTPYVGVGLSYALSKQTSISLTLDRTRAEYGDEKIAVVAAGAGVRVRF